MGELVLSVPTSSSGTAVLIDATLNQNFPTNLGAGQTGFFPWVYGSSTADTLNQGVTRRAQAWNATFSTLAFFAGAPWPTAPSTGTYEVHMRTDPQRKREALNEAIGQLSLWFMRDYIDISITTITNDWTYTVPANQFIARIWQIQYQVDTTPTVNIGFPYADAVDLDWSIYTSVDTSGVQTQTIQFGQLPPNTRTLRLRCECWSPDLVNDSDILPLAAQWERPALAWIYKYAQHLLNSWQGNEQPKGDVERYDAQAKELLAEAADLRTRMGKPKQPGRVVVPGKGRGILGGTTALNSPEYLAGLHQF